MENNNETKPNKRAEAKEKLFSEATNFLKDYFLTAKLVAIVVILVSVYLAGTIWIIYTALNAASTLFFIFGIISLMFNIIMCGIAIIFYNKVRRIFKLLKRFILGE
jgi:hypothetical protein